MQYIVLIIHCIMPLKNSRPCKQLGLPCEELWALGGLGVLGDGVVVDELAAGLVQRRDEASLALESAVHHVVVLALHVQDRLHVLLRVLMAVWRCYAVLCVAHLRFTSVRDGIRIWAHLKFGNALSLSYSRQIAESNNSYITTERIRIL